MSNLLSLLQSWTAARQEAPEGELVPFGSSPAASFSLSEGTCACPTRLACELSARALTLCILLAASAPVPGQTVLHVYGSPPRSLQSQLSSIPVRAAGSRPCQRTALTSVAQVGAPVPAEKRLKFASELFDVVDVGGQRVLDAHKLQARCARLREQLNTLPCD